MTDEAAEQQAWLESKRSERAGALLFMKQSRPTREQILRDRFAMAALQGIPTVDKWGAQCTATLIALRAYEIADAMLAERRTVR